MGAPFFLLTICCIYISMVTSTGIAERDSLFPFQTLRSDQTLVSENNRFEFGFFNFCSKCPTKIYLGIWYKHIPSTVVWVANRMVPIQKLGGRLIFDITGSLVLQDDSGTVFLICNLANTTQRPILKLLDSGNLVVRYYSNLSDGKNIWQSFDYPSDTLLPGMKLGWDFKTGVDRVMTSWKNTEDPSYGDFLFSLESIQSPKLVLEKNLIQQARWGPWDGQRFSGSNAFRTNPVFKSTYYSNADEVYYTFEVLDDSTILRFVVSPMGDIQFLQWKDQVSQWIALATLNKDSCDLYGSCGAYGVCDVDDPSCQCLKGFSANSPNDWGRMDWSGGCKRNYELNCSDGDVFVKYERLKLPDNSIVWPSLSTEECGYKCLEECTCMAYSSLNVYGNGSQCVIWLGDLFDIRNFPHGGDKIYIRMAHRELALISLSKREKGGLMIIVIFLSTVTVMFLSGIIRHFICQIRREKRQAQQENFPYREFAGSLVEDLDYRLFDFGTVSTATNNFSLDNRIGHGGFGPVYKGQLTTGQPIAVKRLSETSGQGLEEFKNEISLIAKLQHRNLVKLLGYCIHREERMLVYEYMTNRSLDQIIFDQARRRLLSWEKRFHIVKGVAKGLAYLHHDSRLRIIHRDLKSSNILLDSEMNPKISDFGLARIFREEAEEMTKRVIGTHGYMSPEYLMNGVFSTKSDVYSFGVSTLEIISGNKNWGFHHPDHDYNLLGHAWKLWNDGKPLELIDSVLEESLNETEVVRCIHIGLLCVQQRPDDRPTMCSVVSMLQNDSSRLTEPQQPGFFSRSSSVRNGSLSKGQNHYSTNGVTVTTLDGR